MDPITSLQNPKVKQARALRNRKARLETGLCLVEGIFHVGEALAAGAAVETLFYAPDLLKSDFGRGLVAQAERQGVPCISTTPGVFASMAAKEGPQGLLAVVGMPHTPLEALTPENFPWGVALVTPQDPGNVGTILRTIDAVGASGLLLLDGGADPWHPTAMRASMGAVFSHPVAEACFEAFAGWARVHGYTVYGTSARGIEEVGPGGAFERPCILLLGSEREGLLPEQTAVCTRLLRLPMAGRVRSLNLAVAAGVLLYAMRG